MNKTVTQFSDDEYRASNDGPVSAVILARERDLGNFSVRRYLPHSMCRRVGPFVFFDHMGPAEFAPGTGLDVRPHPHIGLATLTYLFQGEIVHRDSLGYVQVITPGAVNWMTAGRGIVHSERSGDTARANGQILHGLQVWVALPEQHEEAAPAFDHYRQEDLPVLSEGGVTMRLIAGSGYSLNSPVKTYSPLFYLDISMPAGSTLGVTDEYPQRAVHVVSGELMIGDDRLDAFNMAILRESASVTVQAVTDSRLVIFGGAPVSDRIVWWNFVARTRERIEQAKTDWQEGRFGEVPGETEFIPLPEERAK